jgi:hypothetical protein
VAQLAVPAVETKTLDSRGSVTSGYLSLGMSPVGCPSSLTGRLDGLMDQKVSSSP